MGESVLVLAKQLEGRESSLCTSQRSGCMKSSSAQVGALEYALESIFLQMQ